jgi:hypothetical protein
MGVSLRVQVQVLHRCVWAGRVGSVIKITRMYCSVFFGNQFIFIQNSESILHKRCCRCQKSMR